MECIEHVAIVGMGALGLLYADIAARNIGTGHVDFLMDEERFAKNQGNVFTVNGVPTNFSMLPQHMAKPYDLVIVAVKYTGLQKALDVMAGAVGPDTIIISVMNGISSESIIAERFGSQNVLHVVAQGMDAMRFGSALRYSRKGHLCIGMDAPEKRGLLDRLSAFLLRAGIDFVEEKDIRGKFMLNVGINQTCMVFGGGYGRALAKGSLERMTFISAMREVVLLARCEGIDLGEEDLAGYVELIKTLDPEAMPSMAQDRINKRFSEVELFAGTVIRLANRHSLPVPVNEFLYEKVKEIERGYNGDF